MYNQVLIKSILRTADKQFFYSEGQTTIWSCNINTSTEGSNDTKPSYHINNSPERNSEALLKKSMLTKEDKVEQLKKKIALKEPKTVKIASSITTT